MSPKRKLSMLKDIVAEVDYDIYKQLFVEDCMEDEDASEQVVNNLMKIVEKYVDAPKE